MSRHHKILAPTDFSRAGNLAVNYAMHLAQVNKATLVVMTVLEDLLLTDEELMMVRVKVGEVRKANRAKITAAQAKLERVLLPAARKTVKAKFLVRDGKPYLEIIRAAQELKADLIVMPSSGQHGLKEMLLGSTTDRVVGKAPCSVLVVRGKRNALKRFVVGPHLR